MIKIQLQKGIIKGWIKVLHLTHYSLVYTHTTVQLSKPVIRETSKTKKNILLTMQHEILITNQIY